MTTTTTTTERTITPYDELSVEPEPIIAPELIQPAPAESWRRGREFHVYKVPSLTEPIDRTVVYNAKDRTIYCDCPARTPCRHVKSVLWKRAYELAYRLYHDLSLPELAERQRDSIEMERGALVQVRAWRATSAAIGDLVRDRLDGAA